MCVYFSLHCFPSPACRLNVAFVVIAAAAVVVAAAVIAAAAVVLVLAAVVVLAAAAVLAAVVVVVVAATVLAAAAVVVVVVAAAILAAVAVVVSAVVVVVAVAAAVVVVAVVVAAAAAAAIVKALVYAGSPLFLLNVSSLSCRARSGGHSPQEDTKWYKKESPTNQSRPLPCVTKLGVTHQELSNRLFYRTWPVLYFVAIPRVVILLGA